MIEKWNGKSRTAKEWGRQKCSEEKRVSKDLAKDRNTWLPSKRNRTTHANMEIFKANLNGIRIKLTYFFPEKLNTKY